MKHEFTPRSHSNLIYQLLLLCIVTVFTNSCKKKEDDQVTTNKSNIPVLTTVAVSDVTQASAKCESNVTSDGGSAIFVRGVCWSTQETPTISDNKTADGNLVGNYTSYINSLSANTKYYVRAYATNSNGTGYGNTLSFTTSGSVNFGSFIDNRDGNVYKTVTIGNQVWMAENLRYLPSVNGQSMGSAFTPLYYVYGYDGNDVNAAKAISYYTMYGVLYNWAAAMNGATSSSSSPSGVQGICPAGWHLPSEDEWTELINYVGGQNVAGGKLKESGTLHWNIPNIAATNEFGFSALPAGYRHIDGLYSSVGDYTSWWCATEKDSFYAYYQTVSGDKSNSFSGNLPKQFGLSIRCVKD